MIVAANKADLDFEGQNFAAPAAADVGAWDPCSCAAQPRMKGLKEADSVRGRDSGQSERRWYWSPSLFDESTPSLRERT